MGGNASTPPVATPAAATSIADGGFIEGQPAHPSRGSRAATELSLLRADGLDRLLPMRCSRAQRVRDQEQTIGQWVRGRVG